MAKSGGEHATGRLIAAKAAARYLGIPYTSLRDCAFRGEIAVVKFGRAWFFERADLDRLIDTHKGKLDV